MSATELIEQFKALPPTERAQVAKFVVENDDSWISESFKQGMADAEARRFVDLGTALTEPPVITSEVSLHRDPGILAQFRQALGPADRRRRERRS